MYFLNVKWTKRGWKISETGDNVVLKHEVKKRRIIVKKETIELYFRFQHISYIDYLLEQEKQLMSILDKKWKKEGWEILGNFPDRVIVINDRKNVKLVIAKDKIDWYEEQHRRSYIDVAIARYMD